MTDRYARIRKALADMDAAAEARNALAWRDAHDRFAVHAVSDTIRELLAERDQLAAALEAEREEVVALEAEVEALRKDAERYRWLRDANINTLPYDNHGMGPEFPYDDDLDATIDAALAQGQGGSDAPEA